MTILGNYYDKYGSNNPIERFLLKNYEVAFKKIISSLDLKVIYEVGSGEGVILKWISEIKPDITLYGSDIGRIFDLALFANAPIKPGFLINNAEYIPFSDKPADLIIACEVLEHLVDPSRCLREFQRLHAPYYLLTVPNDRLWKMLNLARFKYIRDFGNTPGHIQHWSRRSFCRFVSQYLDVQYSLYVQPWIFVLAKGNRPGKGSSQISGGG